MNPIKWSLDQWLSIVRSGLKIGGAWLAQHGYSQTGAWLNSSEIIGIAMAAAGFIWSQVHHAPANAPGVVQGKLSLLLCLSMLVCPLALVTGCQAPAERQAFSAVQAPAVSADAIMTAWGDYVKSFHPGADAERKVLHAYQKYRAIELTAIDSAQTLANSLGTTNSPGTILLQAAQSPSAAAALADLLAIVRAFGVKI